MTGRDGVCVCVYVCMCKCREGEGLLSLNQSHGKHNYEALLVDLKVSLALTHKEKEWVRERDIQSHGTNTLGDSNYPPLSAEPLKVW